LTSLLHQALGCDRVGIAFRELASSALAVDSELLALYDQQAAQPAAMTPAQLARLGHRWMLRQDLLGYILFGDPATRLPITPATRAAPPDPGEPLAVIVPERGGRNPARACKVAANQP